MKAMVALLLAFLALCFLTCTIFKMCTFPKCAPYDSSIWPEDLFDCQTFPLSHKRTQKCLKICVYAKKRTHRFITTDNAHPYTHKHTLSSSSLPLGVNTFFYLVDIYRHRINILPFPCTSPWSCRHCSMGRNDLLDGEGPSVSPITKPTDL